MLFRLHNRSLFLTLPFKVGMLCGKVIIGIHCLFQDVRMLCFPLACFYANSNLHCCADILINEKYLHIHFINFVLTTILIHFTPNATNLYNTSRYPGIRWKSIQDGRAFTEACGFCKSHGIPAFCYS